ncbi:MAG: DUF721 domain-containing protein [Actinomycetota bacterium]
MGSGRRRFDGRPTDEELLDPGLGNSPGPTPIGESLERFVRNLGAPPIRVLSQLEERWPDLVGPGLSATTRPVELVDGVLTIGCEDAAWAAQVGWMEGQIIERFDAMFGAGRLDRVVTRVDR